MGGSARVPDVQGEAQGLCMGLRVKRTALLPYYYVTLM